MTGDRLSVIEKQLDDTETRESTVINKQRHPAGPIILLLLVVAGLAIAGCSGKNRTNPAGETLPAKELPTQVRTTQPQENSTPTDAVKIHVNQAGLVRVPAKELDQAGFDVQAHEPGQLSLSLAGAAVPFLAMGDGSSREIVFYGQPRESRYNRDNVYWLRWNPEGETTATQPMTRTVSAIEGEPIGSFKTTRHLEESTQYLSQTPSGTDHWLWQSIFAPGAYTVTLDLPNWAAGDVDLSMSLWGNTEGQEDPDHHAILRMNGQDVADSTWDGKGWHTITATIPAETLQETGNELVLVAPGDTQANVDVVYLDRIDLTYPRKFTADDGRLEFTAQADKPIAVQGLGASDVLLWDVTDPVAPQQLDGALVESGTLRFQDKAASGERTYVAASQEALLVPAAIEPATGVDLRQNATGADYIAVVHPDFIEALQPLMDYRRSQGLRVSVASIDDVYDTFSFGMPDPAAIREYMIYARDHWTGPAPRFLLLVGDASYDYQGFLPKSTPNFVPTYLLATHFVGETASDNWFVSLDDEDDRPDMAVGRIPAQTPQQVVDVVAKTLAYEQDANASEWVNKALFVADDKENNFQTISDDLASTYLPKSYQVEKVYLGKSENPNAELVQSLQDGVGFVTYVGHGSMNVWAQEKILQTADVAKLNNTSLPFMMTMTCLVGYFHHPQATSMGEELLFKPNGGVVAALVPTSESLASDQSELASSIYKHLFGDAQTVGEAIMLGKQDLTIERDIMQDLIETFALLGDPALRMQKPTSSE